MSPYDSKVTSSSNTPNRGRTSSVAGKSSSSSGSVSSSAGSLKQGQVFRGEIIEIRRQEVKIQLPNSEVITAKLEGDVEFTVGQRAAFQVNESSSKIISLKFLPGAERDMQELTIDKALSGAGLPATERNVTIVRELLQYRLSIDKNSIQNLIKQAATFRNTSISTLVLMNKTRIPLTEENAVQLEAYRNSEHRILSQVSQLAQSIIEKITEDPVSSVAVHNEILHLAINSSPSVIPQTPDTTILSSLLTSDDLLSLVDALESFPLTEELRISILNGTTSIRDTAQFIISALNDTAEQLLQPETNTLQEEEIQTKLSIPSVYTILDEYKFLQAENHELGALLPEAERLSLLSDLQGLPLNSDIQASILSGDFTADKFLTIVKDNLLTNHLDLLTPLFQNETYHTLLKSELLHHWTIEPKQLRESGTLKMYYQQLEEELSILKNLSSQQSDTASLNTLFGKSEFIQNNIEFMRTLNDFFPYVQLPMKFSEQNTHGELYVYTKKKNLDLNSDTVRVLLHLDMDHLGSMDIHLELFGKRVISKFNIEDSDSAALITEHLPILNKALENKGFYLSAQVETKKKERDFVKDFFEPDFLYDNMKRYTFDVKT